MTLLNIHCCCHMTESAQAKLVGVWDVGVMRGDPHLPAGFSGDSISINPSKTRLSFPMQTPDGLCLPATTFRDGAGRSFMKWCGLLVNCQTLELQADYTRYMGTRLADSMALPLNQVRSHW